MGVISAVFAAMGCTNVPGPVPDDATPDAEIGQDVPPSDMAEGDGCCLSDADADAGDGDTHPDVQDVVEDSGSEMDDGSGEIVDAELDVEADAQIDADILLDADRDADADADVDPLADADAISWVDAGPDCTGDPKEWCPCEENDDSCCTTIGEGLHCLRAPPFPPVHVESEYVWSKFYDCGCWPGPPCEDWPVYPYCPAPAE
ncbi:MAG: hypothetical protein H6744_14695 [Deltaproteobacteria bacterium]|nr:hypothetical protein [Deltaproteobacteria bacterium]MCB9787930.1 hypothetical protein [Deltaproteobacteria bacterium]